jgi:hypothetical protein
MSYSTATFIIVVHLVRFISPQPHAIFAAAAFALSPDPDPGPHTSLVSIVGTQVSLLTLYPSTRTNTISGADIHRILFVPLTAAPSPHFASNLQLGHPLQMTPSRASYLYSPSHPS